MGTRAAFWVGDPRDEDNRDWLGCRAFDGYPDNPEFAAILAAKSADEFRKAVQEMSATKKSFARPDGGWPYPWADDIFLTDFTYAFFADGVQVTHYHCGFRSAAEVMAEGFEWPDEDDQSLSNVPAGLSYDRSQPDSIMILRMPAGD